ncbi:hypothetical protein ACTXT7_002345 [Hymenolepis weldensis]
MTTKYHQRHLTKRRKNSVVPAVSDSQACLVSQFNAPTVKEERRQNQSTPYRRPLVLREDIIA